MTFSGRGTSRSVEREARRLHSITCEYSSVVKCLWEVFVWGVGGLFLSCVCVSVSGVLFSVEREARRLHSIT